MFKVNRRINQPVSTYAISDLLGDDIKGKFYRQELQPISFDPNTYEYKIERVLQTKTDRKTGLKTHLVKWIGFPEKFNSWINDGAIRRLGK